MSDWEQAPRRYPRGATVALIVALLAAAGVASGLLAQRDDAPSPRLEVDETATDVAVAPGATTPADDAPWSEPRRGLWRVLPAAPLTPRVAHAMVPTGDQVLVWGGFDVAGLPLTDGGLFDPDDGTWSAVETVAVDGRSPTYTAWSGRHVVIVSATSTYRFDPETDATVVFAPPPLPRGHVLTDQVVGSGDGAFALTRPVNAAGTARSAVVAIERNRRRWTRLPNLPVPVSTGDLLLADDDRVVVFTRAAAGRPATGMGLDRGDRSAGWTPVAVPQALTGQPLVRLLGGMTDDRMLLVGIAPAGTPGFTAVHDGRRWREGAPPPSTASSQVDGLWTGDGLIVWDRLTGSGARADLATARWTRTPVSPVVDGTPRPAAWTGSSIVTWGGFDPAGALFRAE